MKTIKIKQEEGKKDMKKVFKELEDKIGAINKDFFELVHKEINLENDFKIIVLKSLKNRMKKIKDLIWYIEFKQGVMKSENK